MVQPVAGGLMVGVMAGSCRNFWVLVQACWRSPERKDGAPADGLVAAAKAYSRSTSYASGNAGGIFGPSLFWERCWEELSELLLNTSCRDMPLRREPTRW